MNWKISDLLILVVTLLISCRNSEQLNSKVAEYASTESLTEVEDVLNSGAGWKLIDLRKPEEFGQGHIPGAQNVWRTDITDTTFPYGGMMPTQHQMEELLSELGLTPTDTILIYDEKAECDAARLWWILKFYGHQNIKLLNGGLAAWKSSGNHLVTNVTPAVVSNYEFKTEPDSSLLAVYESVQEIQNSKFVLLDTRGEKEYTGEFHKTGAAFPGHINGAVNLDWAMTVDYDGTQKFLPTDMLKARFAEIGVSGSEPVITYCHSGVRSAHTLFVLTELLGYSNIKNYDGSWIEWSHLNDTLSR